MKETLRFFFLSFVWFFLLTSCNPSNTSDAIANSEKTEEKKEDMFQDEILWMAPDTLLIPKNYSGRMIRYGRSLVANTSSYFGPCGSIGHFTNGMNCQNVHLDAGTKPFGNSYSAVALTYPKFRARSGSIEKIEKRVNDCLERSLNGKPLDTTSREMKAIVACIRWIGKNVKKGEVPAGAGLTELPFLNRLADPEKGRNDYDNKCVS